jgi:hypothetical protein
VADVASVLALVIFFVVAVAFVRLCDRIGRSSDGGDR